MTDAHSGSCFCGAVTVQVTGDPISEGFCHCNDCRAWSGAPVTAYSLWPAPQVRYTAGADKLVRYSKTGTTVRVHCGVCGSLIAVELEQAGLVDVFPLRLQGRAFVPRVHVHYGVRVVDMGDGLPKFADMPKEAGGSGEMIPD